jgi:predicted AAA+ superfamily ATPase
LYNFRVSFLWKGGFPALWSDTRQAFSRERWYQGYVATYLERDVRSLLNVGSLRDFERFLRACVVRCGQVLNLSDVGRDVGISTPTAKKWLSVMQASNQVFLLEWNRKIAAVECKIKEKPEKRDLHGIKRLQKFSGKKRCRRPMWLAPPLIIDIRCLMQ